MYKIRFTEQNNQKTHDFETSALLYLLSMRNDSDEISIFFIDCLNDVTGSNDNYDKLWDTQAKGVASLYPTTIGESLITLFENYISELDFIESVLILPKIKEGYLKNEDSKSYGIENFKDEKRDYLVNGLMNEYKRRNDISDISSEIKVQINSFLEKIIFIVALEKEEYIKEIVDFRKKDSFPENLLESIFNEIRDYQSTLKNINIEDLEISNPSELLEHNKYMKSSDIRLMVLNRFVGTELFKNNHIPINYTSELVQMNQEDIRDLILENNSNISRAFFNKNNKRYFWRMLENILQTINSDKSKSIRSVLSEIDKNLLRKNPPLEENSILFFISLIKDGLDDS